MQKVGGRLAPSFYAYFRASGSLQNPKPFTRVPVSKRPLMAFRTILRRSISSGVPLAVREVQRNYHHSVLFTALRHSSFSRQPSSRPVASMLHFYSSSAIEPSSDDDLLRCINFEIDLAEEVGSHDKVRFFFFLFFSFPLFALVCLILKQREILFSVFSYLHLNNVRVRFSWKDFLCVAFR